MKELIKKSIRVLLTPFVLKDYFQFKRASDGRFSLSISDFYPQIKDKTVETNFDRHYIYHTAWAARKVRQIAPARHTDISSSLYFSSILSTFIPVDFYDYRPAKLELSNFTSSHADLASLHFADNSVDSLSCMHTIEHIGLGRYGDPINPKSDIVAMKELARVLKPGGSLLFVTPVGKPKIEFNAHRIYSYEQIMEYFKDLDLAEFSLIPEKEGGIIEHADPSLVQTHSYACGCFWFKKP